MLNFARRGGMVLTRQNRSYSMPVKRTRMIVILTLRILSASVKLTTEWKTEDWEAKIH